LNFWAGTSLFLREHFLKPRIQPGAHSERDLEGLYVENDLERFPRGVEDNAASPAPGDVVFKSLPKFGGTLFVYIVREIGQHFLAS